MEKQSHKRQSNRRNSSRKFPRGTVRVECRRGRLGLGLNIATGFLDVSQGGVRLLAKEPFKAEEEVEVVFNAFGIAAPIKRVASVIWALSLENGQFAAGLRFLQVLPHEDLMRLSRP